jgi:hypothetical protein
MKNFGDEICTGSVILCNMFGKLIALAILFLFVMSIIKYFFRVNGIYFWHKNYWNKKLIQDQFKIYVLENLKGFVFLLIILIVVKIFFSEGSNPYSDTLFMMMSFIAPLLSFIKSLF